MGGGWMKPNEIDNDTGLLVQFACRSNARVLADVDLPARCNPTAKRVVDEQDVRADGIDHPDVDAQPTTVSGGVSGARALEEGQRLVADMKGEAHFAQDVRGVVGQFA